MEESISQGLKPGFVVGPCCPKVRAYLRDKNSSLCVVDGDGGEVGEGADEGSEEAAAYGEDAADVAAAEDVDTAGAVRAGGYVPGDETAGGADGQAETGGGEAAGELDGFDVGTAEGGAGGAGEGVGVDGFEGAGAVAGGGVEQDSGADGQGLDVGPVVFIVRGGGLLGGGGRDAAEDEGGGQELFHGASVGVEGS